LPASSNVTVRIPQEIVASYRPIAEREDRSVSKAILVALKRDLAERERNGNPLTGLRAIVAACRRSRTQEPPRGTYKDAGVFASGVSPVW